MSDSHEALAATDPATAGGEEIPTFEALAADPEIAALLDFEPVPRKSSPPNAWTPEAQRMFIAWLAATGAQGKACGYIGKDRGGAKKLYDSPEGGSFRAAWHEAIVLYSRRCEEKYGDGPPPARTPPTVDGRRRSPCSPSSRPSPFEGEGEQGQVLNEHGEWEDAGAYAQRVEDARDSVSAKLNRCRRLYLMAIADEPVKRAAFELLTDWPVDWERARALLPQPEEPWRPPSARNPDLLLAAEHGCFGTAVHGPDRRAALLARLNRWRVKHGLEPIELEEGE